MKISENSLFLRWVYLPRVLNGHHLPWRISLCTFFWRMVFSPIVNLFYMFYISLRWIWRVLNGNVDWLPRPFGMNLSLVGYSIFIGAMYVEIWFISSFWGGAGWKYSMTDYFGIAIPEELILVPFMLLTGLHVFALLVVVINLLELVIGGVVLPKTRKTIVWQVTKEFISAKKQKICPDIEIVS